MTIFSPELAKLRQEQLTVKDLFCIRDALEILKDYGLADEFLLQEVLKDIAELEDK